MIPEQEQLVSRCPQCNAELPPHAPGGMCPKCLLEAGLGADNSHLDETTPAPGFAPPSIDELAPFFPQLEFLELLGRGGMGAVYKARQKELDRLVAIKILPPEVGADPAFAERFLREARALAKLSHPNIVTVYDFGQAGGLYYFMMEYLEGANLRALMSTSQLQPDEALTIIPQICEALQFAHDQGVVHRDIKPENILVSSQGQVKIADFGLVKLLGAAPADYSLTGTQQVMGTLHYMAPEQIQHTHAVDHRADIYSLGVVFYEMLTGQLPIGRFDPPSRRVTLDARLDDIVLRSLESDPLRRYQHASDVLTDIQSLRDAKPPQVSEAPDPRESAPFQPATSKPVPSKSATAPELATRYSRKAIIGAVWAPLFFISIVLALIPTRGATHRSQPQYSYSSNGTMVVQSERGVTWDSDPADASRVTVVGPELHRGPDWLPIILTAAILLPGLIAPFGTTILGIVAISDIRHARGRVVGRSLAVFDALFYPLLLLDGLVLFFVGMVCSLVFALIARFLNAGVTVWFGLVITLFPGLPICILLDFLIVRAVWRHSEPIE